MNNREECIKLAREVITILGSITLLSFICRLWPIIILGLMGLIFAAIRLLFLKVKRNVEYEPIVNEEPPKEPKVKDVYDMAFSLIQKQISSLVESEFEGAKWVWETVNPRNAIENEFDVYILLSGAGGYRKAKVKIVALRAVALEYVKNCKKEENNKCEEKTKAESEIICFEEPEIDYGLLAYEWVYANILEINNRLNEAIGENKDYLVLTTEELPRKECWDKLCDELLRADIPNTVCTEDGIKIYFNAERQKGNEIDECVDE